jgi:glycosyltransferase involved in cell wall biosynthesis
VQPTVSIIVPTFNRLHYLRAAVQSVVDQTFGAWELLIADDGSSSETHDYLARLEQTFPVRVLRLRHSGNPSTARNAALRVASAEYVAFLDSDDVWLPTKLEAQIASLRKYPDRDWSYTGFTIVDSGLEPLPKAVPFVAAVGQIAAELLAIRTVIVQSSVVARREFLQHVGPYDERVPHASDYHLWVRCALRANADCIAQPLVLVRRHQEHSSNDVAACRDFATSLDLLQPLIRDRHLASELCRRRAIASATLARSQAVDGRRLPALTTLWASAPYAWPYRAWWRGAAAAAARILTPPAARRLNRTRGAGL